MADKKFEEITNHLITSGFIFQGSEIYGGLSNTWDYGPLGVELKNNIKAYYWQKFVHESPTNVGLDAAILMNPKVWEATGHVENFSDPLIDCKHCHSRYRADDLIEELFPSEDVKNMTNDDLNNFIKSHRVVCPKCGKNEFTEIRQFNMMFRTHIGVTEGKETLVYLRPETAQAMFVNFKNVQRSMRKKLPFGIASIGKSFRNEITPGNFTFRTREFEQMELEFFCKPDTDLEWFKYWKQFCLEFIESFNIKPENLRYRDHEPHELAFYSKATTDIEYRYPFGWGELLGIADRTNYDLGRHQNYSGEDLSYLDTDSNEKYLPYVIEPSMGLDRLFLMVVCEAYDKEQLENDERIVMRIKKSLAPYKVAILPLSKQLSEQAFQLVKTLNKFFSVTYDVTGSIGKRYRRQDAIGTPFCVTFDFDSLLDQQVTVRERDSMKQVRLPISELVDYLKEQIEK